MTAYTDEQMDRVMQMPVAVLLSAMMAGTGGAVVNMHEFMAGEKFISEAGTVYPRNPLIQHLVANVNLPKLEEIIQHVFTTGDQPAMRAECQRKIDAGLAVLAHDDEANQFKIFLIMVADKVVNYETPAFRLTS